MNVKNNQQFLFVQNMSSYAPGTETTDAQYMTLLGLDLGSK